MEAFIVSSDEWILKTPEQLSLPVKTLAYCSSLQIADSSPSGCAILTVSEKCQVHLVLKMLVLL